MEDIIDLLLNVDSIDTERSDVEMRRITGLTNDQFNSLLEALPTLRGRYKELKTAETALFVYLNRLRKGHFYHDIGASFGVSKNTTINYISAARNALLTDFVPQYLGFQSFTREKLLENTTDMSRIIYDTNNEKIITIWDGTYIYINRSQNHYAQRIMFSVSKGRHLVKPMVCVTPNGTYVDVFGPYPATMNYAKIMEKVFNDHSIEMMGVLSPGDIFLTDRGFRDCADVIKRHGFDIYMPEFVEKDDLTGQSTTKKGNNSRLVTANRFVIEARNGNIKTIWKVFDLKWHSSDLRHLNTDWNNLCFGSLNVQVEVISSTSSR